MKDQHVEDIAKATSKAKALAIKEFLWSKKYENRISNAFSLGCSEFHGKAKKFSLLDDLKKHMGQSSATTIKDEQEVEEGIDAKLTSQVTNRATTVGAKTKPRSRR